MEVISATFEDGTRREFNTKHHRAVMKKPRWAAKVTASTGKVTIMFFRDRCEIKSRVRNWVAQQVDAPSLPPRGGLMSAWFRAEVAAFKELHGLTSDDEVRAKRKAMVSEALEQASIELVETKRTTRKKLLTNSPSQC